MFNGGNLSEFNATQPTLTITLSIKTGRSVDGLSHPVLGCVAWRDECHLAGPAGFHCSTDIDNNKR